MTKRKLTKNLRSARIIKITTTVVAIILGIVLGVHQFLPQIKAVLLSETDKEESPKHSTSNANFDSNKTFEFKDINNSSLSVITSNNSNVAVNSNNVTNGNNVANSNNKITQKIENNFSEGSKTINNYSSPILRQLNYKIPETPKPNQITNNQQRIQQQTQSPPVAQGSSFEDQNVKKYFTLIENHRNRGADLAKCNSVRLCLELYNNWQNQANNLLSEIDSYLQQKYRKRSELQQKFGSETFDAQIFPDTKTSLESLQSIFFNRANLFGMLNSSLKNSLNSL